MRTAFPSLRTRRPLPPFPVVTGIAIGVLMQAKRRFSRTDQQLFEAPFESQIPPRSKARHP